MDCSTPGFPVLHHLPELAQSHVHRVSDAIQPFHLLSPLLIQPSIFPSIRVFSKESPVHIRWPKYWSFSISSSNEYSGLISFRIDQFDLLAAQGTQARNHLKYIWQQTKGSWSMKIICILFPPWRSLWASLTSLMSISNSAVWTECPSLIVL